jgi:hypothetical protein
MDLISQIGLNRQPNHQSEPWDEICLDHCRLLMLLRNFRRVTACFLLASVPGRYPDEPKNLSVIFALTRHFWTAGALIFPNMWLLWKSVRYCCAWVLSPGLACKNHSGIHGIFMMRTIEFTSGGFCLSGGVGPPCIVDLIHKYRPVTC